jgi:hypothetical protein
VASFLEHDFTMTGPEENEGNGGLNEQTYECQRI